MMSGTGTQMRNQPDWPFYLGLSLIGGFYVMLIIALLIADLSWTTTDHWFAIFTSPAIRSAIVLSLASCTVTAIVAMWVAVPLGYLLARCRFPGRILIDLLVDIPVVLPPVVVGLSLLLLFRTPPGIWFQTHIFPVAYARPGLILAQFVTVAAFAIRSMRGTFEQIDPRAERVALTLGCTRAMAFSRVTLPMARRGIVAAFTTAWARAMGEFGPILIFCGATRHRTEVLSTTVSLELWNGQTEAALAVAWLMILMSATVSLLVRMTGQNA